MCRYHQVESSMGPMQERAVVIVKVSPAEIYGLLCPADSFLLVKYFPCTSICVECICNLICLPAMRMLICRHANRLQHHLSASFLPLQPSLY